MLSVHKNCPNLTKCLCVAAAKKPRSRVIFCIQACQRGVKRVYWTGKMRDFSVTESRNAHGEEARI